MANLTKIIILSILLASSANAKLKLDSCNDLDHGKYTHFDDGNFAVCESNKVVCYKNLVSETFSDSPVKSVDCASINGGKFKRKLGVYMNGRPGEGKPWPKGVMCYKISGQFSSQEIGHIKKAAADINAVASKTGASAISIDQCKPNDGVCGGCKNYVDVQSKQQGCFSLVGYAGKVQPLNLQPRGCFNRQEGTPLHEFGHALGLYHEHSHPKREVIPIQSHFRVPPSNYAVQKGAGTTPYDKASIMHYPPYDGKQRTGLCIPLARYKNTKFCGLEERNGANGCVEATEQHCDTQAAKNIGKTKKFSTGDIAALKAIYKGGSGETEQTPSPKTMEPEKGSGSGTTPGKPGPYPKPSQSRPSVPGVKTPEPETGSGSKQTTKKCAPRRLRVID